MEFSEPTLAAGRLLGILLLLLVLLRLHVRLWLSILAGALALCLSSGISPASWPGIAASALAGQDFLLIAVMIFLIMLLSGVQDVTGQNRKLVNGIERYLDRPRLRLVLFPALIGLLPMPGGALFSCPMIRDAARGMSVTDEKKALINYWFRHIWELAWPLYPGYALVCSLLGISMTLLWQYTFPLVFLAFGVGWFFYMRAPAGSPPLSEAASRALAERNAAGHRHEGICASREDGSFPEAEAHPENLGRVLLHALPVVVTLAGAAVFGVFLRIFFPEVPGQTAFVVSLVCGICTALYQGRGHMGKSLLQLALSRNTGRILLLLGAVYIFKECMGLSGIVQALSHFGESTPLILLAFIVVPFISGMLTGIMVAFVGVSFPILLGILDHSPLKEYTLPLITLAMVAGNCGQMLSPLHVCLVVTCEFFSTRLPGLWKSLLLPTVLLMAGGIAWVSVLAAAGARF